MLANREARRLTRAKHPEAPTSWGATRQGPVRIIYTLTPEAVASHVIYMLKDVHARVRVTLLDVAEGCTGYRVQYHVTRGTAMVVVTASGRPSP
jgi:hypothetical protein